LEKKFVYQLLLSDLQSSTEKKSPLMSEF